MSGCAHKDSHSEDVVAFLCFIFLHHCFFFFLAEPGAGHIGMGTKIHPPFNVFG